MSCPRLEKCPMFPNLKGMHEIWKTVFCTRDPEHQSCARFLLFSSGQPVPTDLLPNGKLLSGALDADSGSGQR